MKALLSKTSDAWVEAVLGDFNAFLLDHAACERKASAMAMTFIVRYPDRDAIHEPMIRLAKEELSHFHEVFRLIKKRGLRFRKDSKDSYVNGLLRHVRQGRDIEFLDRLVMAGVVEARGHERFDRLAQALPPGELHDFYHAIAQSEARHAHLFPDLAKLYFDEVTVAARWDDFLSYEAELIAQLPAQPALH
ncbi:MAG: tRNA-(ms[2]io[6]A)-hydroxylase [Myxococcota bacterium]|nr:tRNA-(ms[2]io[6]A)-hydroxylase [Myxococcota bacterium]